MEKDIDTLAKNLKVGKKNVIFAFDKDENTKNGSTAFKFEDLKDKMKVKLVEPLGGSIVIGKVEEMINGLTGEPVYKISWKLNGMKMFIDVRNQNNVDYFQIYAK